MAHGLGIKRFETETWKLCHSLEDPSELYSTTRWLRGDYMMTHSVCDENDLMSARLPADMFITLNRLDAVPLGCVWEEIVISLLRITKELVKEL